MRMFRWRSYAAAVPLALMLGGVSAPAAVAQGGCPWGAGGAAPGPGDYGMGPGMMWGSGGMMGPGSGMGPGMMGGYGMGPGMMNGYGMGGFNAGPGRMGGFGPGLLAALDLSDEQRQKIRDIHAQQRRQQWELGGQILEEQAQLNELYASDTPDPKQVGAVYERMAKLQRQQLEAQVAAHNKIHAVLTKEQREQLKQWHSGFARGYGQGGRMPGPGMMRR